MLHGAGGSAKSLPPHTHLVPWVLYHGGLMEHTYHVCSSSAPPLGQAHRGSLGRCCASSRTTPAAPGQEGSSAEKEARGGQGGSGQCVCVCERQSSLHSQEAAVLAPAVEMWLQSQPQENQSGLVPLAMPSKLHKHGRPWDALLPSPCPASPSAGNRAASQPCTPKLMAAEQKPPSKHV